MSQRRKLAAEALRRGLSFLAGAGLGVGLGQLVGTLLNLELHALQLENVFIPLSTFVGGVAAVGAWTHFGSLSDSARDAVRRRRLRIALTVFVIGTALLLGLYFGFTRRVTHIVDNGQASHLEVDTFIIGWSRSQYCNCPPNEDDVTCIKSVTLDPNIVHTCWNGASAIQFALALTYLLTLLGAGAIPGLLMVRSGPRAGESPQTPRGYLDFDLWIDQRAEGVYRAKAWSGGAGFEATGSFTLPPDLANGEIRYGGSGELRGGAGTASGSGPTREAAGAELFRTVFQGELLKAFQGCLAKARSGPGLRIRLRLNDVPQLASLPWEYLCDPEGQGFLALSARTPVIRYMELAEELGTLLVEPPLRVLAVISTPQGYRELAEADEEWRRLCSALGPLRHGGLIEIERLAHPILAALEERLRTGSPVHVLHFVGHGGFSELRGEGVLVFEDEQGDGVPVGGPGLAYLLQDHPSLRLAVLNACNGARSSEENAFAGVAQALVQHGVPAVIAMQSEVMDETACSFAEKFYRGLAAGLPVDACVGEVRRALAAEHNPEWGTPALYLRATDGRLFAVENGAGSD